MSTNGIHDRVNEYPRSTLERHYSTYWSTLSRYFGRPLTDMLVDTLSTVNY